MSILSNTTALDLNSFKDLINNSSKNIKIFESPIQSTHIEEILKNKNNDFSYSSLKDLNHLSLLEKLQTESDSLLSMFNELQGKNATLEGLIGDFSCLNESYTKSEEKNNEQFKRVFNYKDVEFLPNETFRPRNFNTQMGDIELSESIKENILFLKTNFKTLLDRLVKYNKEITSTYKRLAEMFTFIDLNNFATSKYDEFGIADPYGLLIFYLGVCTFKQVDSRIWNENIKKINDPTYNSWNPKP